MMAYWDSSALVEASQNVRIRKLLNKHSGITRLHALSEVFSTLTGGRLGFRCQPDDAARIGCELAADLKFEELNEKEILHALSSAKKHGVRGGQVHDYLHALTAMKAGATKIYTLNISDFTSLNLPIAIEPPVA
jgi:predicted nucleic acid-binding protein